MLKLGSPAEAEPYEWIHYISELGVRAAIEGHENWLAETEAKA